MNAPIRHQQAFMSAATARKAPLRIAIFSGNYNYVMDGPVRALNKLVAYLENHGHEAVVFAPTVKSPAFDHSGELISIPSLALPGKRSEYRLGLGLFDSAKTRLAEFCPDIVHLAAPDITGFAALKYAKARGITPVASFHTRFDTYPRYYGAKWLEKYITNYMRDFYSRCEHVYAPSPSMADELHTIGFRKNIRLWQRGVEQSLFNPARRDLDWRSANGFADDDVVIAFVGRIVLEKGIDLFAQAALAAQAKNPKIKILVVGEGPGRARFQRMMPDAVFTGYLSGVDLARAYASADIFFNPSITETFGNVTLEAMASGLPVICAGASGSMSLVENGRTGYLANPDFAPDSFTVLLLDLARD